MSGQQIGSAVGFVVGSMFGAPQLGALIGGFIGGAISPTEIEGPHIGDGAQQSSQEGVPITWILGTYGWVQGNIVQKSERREVKKEDDGKGSGQVQVTYEAHQDFCLMVCESSETRNSTVVGPLMVRVNGKIVYDMRPGSNFGAENAKFLQNHTFYVGNEDQVPDPTMEAITGVGNTPSYRGVFTCVARDINLSQYGDAIPTYEWVMVGDGEADVVVTESLAASSYPVFTNGGYPIASPESQYGIGPVENAWMIADPGPFNSLSDALAAASPISAYGDPFQFIGYSASGSGASFTETQPDISDNVTIDLIYNETPASLYFDGLYSDQAAVEAAYNLSPGTGVIYGDSNGKCFTLAPFPRETPPAFVDSTTFLDFNGSGDAWVAHIIHEVRITISREPIAPAYQQGDPCELGEPVQLPDTPGFIIDCEGNISQASQFTAAGSGTYLVLQGEVREVVPGGSGFEKITQYAFGPILENTDPNNTEAFWEAAALEYGVPGVYGADFPDAINTSQVYISTLTETSVEGDDLSVATAIERIAVRGGLAEAQVDTSDVDQTLKGYGISSTYDGADCLRPLLVAYGLYGADYDAQLHFHKLGEDVDIVIDPGEMIAGETHTDQAEREQAVEYPRLILLNYIDPAQDYSARPQPWRRISPDVRAIGEETMQVPVVMTADEAAQTVDTYGKRATARAQGTRKFSVPFAGVNEVYLRLHPGKSFGLDSKRWVIDKLSIEDGELAIEASFDRQSAYTSNVTAIPALPPTPPASNIGGITLFSAMNLPRLRSQDSTPGMYIAVAGLLSSWPGCVLQMSIDDGETWTTAIASMSQESVLGYLTAGMDETPEATLSVNVHGGQLNSISDTQFANGGNPSAVLTSAVAEILQFQTADELEPNEYDLTELGRGRLSTTPAAHFAGDRFVQLDNVYFLPLDISLAGRTIKFRPVTKGTVPDANATYDVVFLPQFTGPQVVSTITVGGDTITVDGNALITVT